jgi:hypothetical protein
MHDYLPLAVHRPLHPAMALVQHDAHAELDDPASTIFTDLRLASSVIVPQREPLAESLRLMQLAGVRMAFVVDLGGRVTGLVTAADVHGERPLVAASRRGVSHADLVVADVMTPLADCATLSFDAVQRARVGDIVATFQATGQRYLIVTELQAGGNAPHEATPLALRGLFSANQAERALGHAIDQSPAAHLRSRSFSELAAALSHG